MENPTGRVDDSIKPALYGMLSTTCIDAARIQVDNCIKELFSNLLSDTGMYAHLATSPTKSVACDTLTSHTLGQLHPSMHARKPDPITESFLSKLEGLSTLLSDYSSIDICDRMYLVYICHLYMHTCSGTVSSGHHTQAPSTNPALVPIKFQHIVSLQPCVTSNTIASMDSRIPPNTPDSSQLHIYPVHLIPKCDSPNKPT